jgi:ubiquitin-conjugating enzyme E2 variant
MLARVCGFTGWHVVGTLAFISMGNEVHAWSHKRPRSTIVRVLQDMKLLLSPEQHARHHRAPYDVCFCTLTNWLNPVLDALRFWRALEWCIALVGIRPARITSARRGY